MKKTFENLEDFLDELEKEKISEVGIYNEASKDMGYIILSAYKEAEEFKSEKLYVLQLAIKSPSKEKMEATVNAYIDEIKKQSECIIKRCLTTL